MYLYNSSYQQQFLTLHLEVWFLNVNFCQYQKLVEKIISKTVLTLRKINESMMEPISLNQWARSDSTNNMQSSLISEFLTSMLINEDPKLTLWIGLNDQRQSRRFTWADNSPLTYTNWFQGEPNNSPDGSHMRYNSVSVNDLSFPFRTFS